MYRSQSMQKSLKHFEQRYREVGLTVSSTLLTPFVMPISAICTGNKLASKTSDWGLPKGTACRTRNTWVGGRPDLLAQEWEVPRSWPRGRETKSCSVISDSIFT